MFINLTPHTINLPDRAIEPSGSVARCSENTVEAWIADDIQLVRKNYGVVTGLPDPVDGTMYIVSALVRMALPSRNDLASPGDAIRDASGKIIGCKNLVIN